MPANRIFDLNYSVYGQKKFSWIYMNSTSGDVYNTKIQSVDVHAKITFAD
jgi:hypothetical protein